jgi:hypothetical protein
MRRKKFWELQGTGKNQFSINFLKRKEIILRDLNQNILSLYLDNSKIPVMKKLMNYLLVRSAFVVKLIE